MGPIKNKCLGNILDRPKIFIKKQKLHEILLFGRPRKEQTIKRIFEGWEKVRVGDNSNGAFWICLSKMFLAFSDPLEMT